MFVDIPLPPPVVVSPIPLIFLYASVASLDYVLLKHRLVLTSRQWRFVMPIYHVIIPLCIVSPYKHLDILFAASPWLIATYTAHFDTESLSIVAWIRELISIPLDEHHIPTPQCRREGCFKIARGLFKIVFMKTMINPWLPTDPAQLLDSAWLDPIGLWQTLLFGIKVYCMLGAVDAFMGLEQAVLGLRFLDLFHSPILAYSPRDFWSHRWNRIVRNLLHRILFTKNGSASGFTSSHAVRGFLAFAISGTFHELIVMSTCRRITFENMAFFTLQGLAVLIEVTMRNAKTEWKQAPTGWLRLICILFHLFFLSLTGRLFLAPFLRSNFMEMRKS